MRLSGRARGEASGRTYDVFISHAGPQKATFAVWLQRELRRHGISAFLDETSLRYCDAADAEMEATLRSCSLVVFVLTRDFVRSRYCMDELHWALHPSQAQQHSSAGAAAALQPAAGSAPQDDVQLRQSTKQGSSQPLLLPVFYHISDIDALQRDVERQIAAEREAGASSAALQRLRQAGADLGDLCGFVGIRGNSHNELDSFHVDAIVAEVLQRLNRPTFQAPTYAVDVESRVQALLPLLQPDQPGGVRVLSLHGMGGIGKTTLARALFNQLGGSGLCFSSHIFLEVGQDVILLDKQRELFQMLAGSSLPTAGSAAQLQQQLERCTQNAGPLLLVLDDIWTVGQRDALLCLSALPEGSRVVLTGRDSSSLHPEGGSCLLRPVVELAHAEAEQLLCWHAFTATHMPEGYQAAVQQALDVWRGLPLALQVVGAGMRSRSPEAAEGSIMQLLAEPGVSSGSVNAAGTSLDVLAILERSFKQLPSDNHRHMFLDAALLMRGHPQEHLLLVWAGILQQQHDIGLQQPSMSANWTHQAEALWTVCAGATLVACRTSEGDVFSRVQLHDCMVEMARAVSRRSSHPASWSLSSLSPTTRLPQVGSLEAESSRLYCGPPGVLHKSRWTVSKLLNHHQQCRLAAVELPPHSHGRLHSWIKRFTSSSPGRMPQKLLYLRLTNASEQMAALNKQLRVLDMSGEHLCGRGLRDSIAACSELRHLGISDLRLRSLPPTIGSLSHMEALLLGCCSSLVQLPDSITCLNNLQHLDLSKCCRLQQLPKGLGSLTRLRSLLLSNCTKLKQLPDSIGSLASLQTLDVRGCEALQQLPDSIGSLASLETLDLRGCTMLQQLPDSIGSLASLQTLVVSRCEALQQLPHSIGSLASLKRLFVTGCRALQQLPDSIGSLASLQTLNLSFCKALQQLPDSIGSLASLQTLVAGCCDVLQQLPYSITSLASLQTLVVSWCNVLQHLPHSIGSLASLQKLNVSRCGVLQQLPDSIGSLASLLTLDVSGCGVLQQLPDSIGSLASLQTLSVTGCRALQQLPDSIGSLSGLVKLNVSDCRTLQLPDSIGGLASLEWLYMRHCVALQELPDGIGDLASLKLLDISFCEELRQLPSSIGRLSSLRRLDVTACGALQPLPASISSLTNLKVLRQLQPRSRQPLQRASGWLMGQGLRRQRRSPFSWSPPRQGGS